MEIARCKIKTNGIWSKIIPNNPDTNEITISKKTNHNLIPFSFLNPLSALSKIF